ncbi:MAG: metallophosphoesterase family protein [Halobacteriota archaeon]|jgi:putative phosphoesterase
MSQILIFSDLHANERALQDIAPAVKRADLSIFCGDVVGYGVDIESSIDFIMNNVDRAVAGNHDKLAVNNIDLSDQRSAVQKSITYTRRVLTHKQIQFLSALPDELWFQDIYVTHSIGDTYLRSREDLKMLFMRMKRDTKYAFFGHTHEQLLCEHDDQIIINPGSITIGRRGKTRGYVLIQNDDIQFVSLSPII